MHGSSPQNSAFSFNDLPRDRNSDRNGLRSSLLGGLEAKRLIALGPLASPPDRDCWDDALLGIEVVARTGRGRGAADFGAPAQCAMDSFSLCRRSFPS